MQGLIRSACNTIYITILTVLIFVSGWTKRSKLIIKSWLKLLDIQLLLFTKNKLLIFFWKITFKLWQMSIILHKYLSRLLIYWDKIYLILLGLWTDKSEYSLDILINRIFIYRALKRRIYGTYIYIWEVKKK